MAVNVLVLGDGTGGLVVSNLLRKEALRNGVDVDVRLIGNSPLPTYQPGLLFLPFRQPGYRSLADIQRRNVQRPQRVEFRVAALLQDRPEVRRDGHPPLRIDPVDGTRQESIHHRQPAPAPPNCRLCRCGTFPSRFQTFRPGKALRSAQPFWPTVERGFCPHREQVLGLGYGISWGNMGVNGNGFSKHAGKRPDDA